MQYIIPQADADKLNQLMPAGIIFAQLCGDVLVFADDYAEQWPVDLDVAVQSAGLGASLAEYVGTLTPLSALTCKIYRYLPGFEGATHTPPVTIDYRTDLDRRLHPKRSFDQGELTDVEYCANAVTQPDGSVAFDDVIVHERYAYTRDTAGFALSRVLTISWMREDDIPHETTKKMVKVYVPQERIAEGKRRRANIVDELEITVAGMLIATEATDPTDPAQVQAALDLGRALLVDYRGEIIDYIEGSVQTLYTRLAADTAHTWLDNAVGGGATIRSVMLSAVNIWGLS